MTFEDIEYLGRRLNESSFKELRAKDPGAIVVPHFYELPRDQKLLDMAVLFPGGIIVSDAMPWLSSATGQEIDPSRWPIPADAFSHPRSAGTFTRFLAGYARERKLIGWSDALAKTSFLPAKYLEGAVLQMKKKGRLQVGMDADVAVFDPATVHDRASYQHPNQTSIGMKDVLVNGTFVIQDGELKTEAFPGKPIRRRAGAYTNFTLTQVHNGLVGNKELYTTLMWCIMRPGACMDRSLSTIAPGLTTTEAPFIEQAKRQGQLYIAQPYELYSEENQESWRKLYSRILPRWELYANQHFRKGIDSLCLDPHHIPHLEDVNRFLCPLTGFQARAVSGYVPAFIFFDCLRNRQFPTTITIRRSDKLDYLPEPDIFHDIAGHVPMHTDKHFAETLVRFGECAHTAAELVSGIRDPETQVHCLTSIIKAMARFFWFTVEFGLMRGAGGLKVYGSGLLSSYGEIAHAIESPEVQRFPIQLEWAINQSFEIDHYQPLLFIVDSFDHLFGLVDQLETWMRAGKLNNVAPGEPAVNEEDLKSFLHAEIG